MIPEKKVTGRLHMIFPNESGMRRKSSGSVAEVRHSAETLLSMIRENGGSLPLNDDSDPAEIAAWTQMSKKVFKRSLGMLLKRGAVEITQNGVKLTGHNG